MQTKSVAVGLVAGLVLGVLVAPTFFPERGMMDNRLSKNNQKNQNNQNFQMMGNIDIESLIQ